MIFCKQMDRRPNDKFKMHFVFLFGWEIKKFWAKNVVDSDILECSSIFYFFKNRFLWYFLNSLITKFQRLNFFGVALTYLEHFMLWRPSLISPPFCIRKKVKLSNKISFRSICERKVCESRLWRPTLAESDSFWRFETRERGLKIGQNCVTSFMDGP
jgi:hypothetical protein